MGANLLNNPKNVNKLKHQPNLQRNRNALSYPQKRSKLIAGDTASCKWVQVDSD